ncbi:hypothetical protein MHB50_20230 [Siminovitchia sp. FSL H7-0308]
MPRYSEALSIVIRWASLVITIEIKLDRNSPIPLITTFMRRKLCQFYHMV